MTLQRLEQFLSTNAQVAQAMLGHEEQGLERCPSLPLGAGIGDPFGNTLDDAGNRGAGGTIGDGIKQDHLVSPTASELMRSYGKLVWYLMTS